MPHTESKNMMRVLGALGGIPLGAFIGVLASFAVLNVLDSRGIYDGFFVLYFGIGFGVAGAIVGLITPKYTLETLRSVAIILIIILLISYAFFSNDIRDTRDIDKDKFIIKGEKNILEKLNINVRYFISDDKKPLYTIYHEGKDRFKWYSDDYKSQYKNNIDARQHEFFINYDSRLFSTFIIGDLKSCNDKVLFDSVSVQEHGGPDKCLRDDFLNFISNGQDIYYNCKILGDENCQKLEPLKGLQGVPSVFLLGYPIGLSEIERDRNKRSFWKALF